MKYLFIPCKNSVDRPHLLVYFAGWGTPVSVVQHLQIDEQYDCLWCYDYQDLTLDFDFSPYQSDGQYIRVVAWSLGVWVADQVMKGKVCQSATAVNGTLYPCHDEYGIPCSIFKATLSQLSESSRQKFERRMCGSMEQLQHYQALAGHRSLASLRSELEFLAKQMEQPATISSDFWTMAVVAQRDMIIPTAHQIQFWQAYSSRLSLKMMEGDHAIFSSATHWQTFWNER